MLTDLLILLTASGVGAVVWLLFFRLETSEPNEWMLVLRNGEPVRAGIGISHYIRWGDKVAKFPSKLNKVSFSAEQVTKEMQGVGVKGVIIWSIYREGDGPFKAYRSMGEELRKQVPAQANDKLREMSNAIVRHRIANSSVQDILTKRDAVRNEIKSEMNKLVNGWGVWLETVEITDVEILSSTLFSNLQTPFREELRAKAETVRMATDLELGGRRAEFQAKTSRLEADANSEKEIFKASEALRVAKESQKAQTRQNEISGLKIALDFSVKSHSANLEEALRTKLADLEHALAEESLAAQIELEKKNQTLATVEAESKAKKLKLQLERHALLANHERQAEEADLELENKLNASADFKFFALEKTVETYKKLPINGMKVFNFGENSGEAAPLAKLFAGFNAIKDNAN